MSVIRPLFTYRGAYLNRSFCIGRSPRAAGTYVVLAKTYSDSTLNKTPKGAAGSDHQQTSPASKKQAAVTVEAPVDVKKQTKNKETFLTEATFGVNIAARNNYEVPEYYEHSTFSYNDYEVDMMKMRIPQPSSNQRRPA